jgi:oligoendopeptidase F
MAAPVLDIPKRKKREFLPEDFTLTDWNSVKPYFEDLKKREITDALDLKEWLADRSELEAYLSENFAWRYIRMTCDTADEKLTNDLNYFIEEIQPRVAPESDQLNQKALASPYLGELTEAGYDIMTRSLKKEVAIFREENVPLLTQIQTEERKYGAIAGAMTVEIDGKKVTLQQASDYQFSTDRAKREEAYRKVQERRLQDKDQLDGLFNELIGLRHQVARNAGFANFRDYMFTALGRFDYTHQDC